MQYTKHRTLAAVSEESPLAQQPMQKSHRGSLTLPPNTWLLQALCGKPSQRRCCCCCYCCQVLAESLGQRPATLQAPAARDHEGRGYFSSAARTTKACRKGAASPSENRDTERWGPEHSKRCLSPNRRERFTPMTSEPRAAPFLTPSPCKASPALCSSERSN